MSSEADSASENSTRPVHGFRMVKALVVEAQKMTEISRAVVAILYTNQEMKSCIKRLTFN